MKFLPIVLAALCLAPCALPLPAQSPPSPKYEMRGVWVATVVNLDWPVRGASPSSQQQALRTMFDKLQQTGINTIFFQIRSESDAMYASTLEPWSYYLTGQQGLPPSPSWDPLAFAIEEAHKRGMELHAWINPFRVIRSVTSTYPKAQNHLSVQHPDWMLTVKTVMLLNPGIPEARQYLVKRYDIDGLHYDDYFYPYEGGYHGRPGYLCRLWNWYDAPCLEGG
ncbi:MAG: family 10 glycosylhydrolase [Haliscomenobacter sp.]|nr:family 10 glycosylhydrolase [Haliscomenobacter sp.]